MASVCHWRAGEGPCFTVWYQAAQQALGPVNSLGQVRYANKSRADSRWWMPPSSSLRASVDLCVRWGLPRRSFRVLGTCRYAPSGACSGRCSSHVLFVRLLRERKRNVRRPRYPASLRRESRQLRVSALLFQVPGSLFACGCMSRQVSGALAAHGRSSRRRACDLLERQFVGVGRTGT
jgi:hypothetical protein